MVRKILLACGIVASILYIVTDYIAISRYVGYSYTDQVYSELLATGSPVRPLMLLISVVPYNLLMAAFAIGVWASAGSKRIARITGAMLIGYVVVSTITPLFFQMDMRGAEVTPTGSLHPALTGVMSLFIVLSMGFGAVLLGRWFRWYSIGTIVTVMVFGVLTSLQVPQMVALQPTHWMGLTERVNIYVTMLWFTLLAVGLLRAQGSTRSERQQSPTTTAQPA